MAKIRGSFLPLFGRWRRLALLAAAVALALAVLAVPAQALIVAGSAADICAAAADPCVIAEQVDVVAGSVLDFGTRAVVLEGAGVLNFGIGDGSLLCGRFAATSASASVTARGNDPNGGTAGGNVNIFSRRRCSGNASLPCFVDGDCSVAGAGICSAGDGSIVVAGKILGNADTAARLYLRAAADVQLDKLVSAAGTLSTSDGGAITVESTQGSITTSDKLEVASGSQGSGGDIALSAALDVGVGAIIDADGGDFDGGSVAIAAGRAVAIGDDVTANSAAGAGFGGIIAVTAGTDISIVGGGATNRLNVSTEGHQSAENYGGDGGTQSYDAGGSIVLSRYVRLDSNGAPPDGFGDSITFSAGAGISIDGAVYSKAKGSFGGGGSIEVVAGGDIVASATALLDVTGFAAGGGDVLLEPSGDLVFDGDAEAGGSSAGVAGRLLALVGGRASIGGTIATAGGSSSFSHGQIRVAACRVSITGSLTNGGVAGENLLIGRENIKVLTGGRVIANGAGGSNTMQYRAAAKPPVVQGTVSPSAILAVDEALVGCPVCGNAEVDQGETCDDGATVDGDGCSAACQDEGCIAQTPGYPSTPLCDDASQCTNDACDSITHTCAHGASDCSDSIACTADACAGTTCTHTPMPAECADTNPCTLDLCSTNVGCLHTPQDGTCDDGVFCDGTDSCAGGTCSGHAGDPCVSGGECADACDEVLDSCFDPSGTACTDDADVCTDDTCDGAGTCVHNANTAPCDDGLFCTGADVCALGACSVHGGDPCASGPQCQRVCDESGASCVEPAGTPCADDGNSCTDDWCDASGSCTHPPIASTCDDLDLCTTDETCDAGQCVATPAPELSVTALKASLRSGADDDALVLKGGLALSALTVAPSDVDVRLVVTDLIGGVLYDATVPLGAFVNARGAGSVFRFRASSPLQAGGIVKALFKKIPALQTVRLRFKVDAVDLTSLGVQPMLSVALLLGDTPGTAPCASAIDLGCTGTAVRLSCKSP
ncbi:MAG: hypothetical protein HY899_12375 [Deltaproteobacteria bacterium]|nr:hypothetical protein [Deltaproteobacteria bacterium]